MARVSEEKRVKMHAALAFIEPDSARADMRDALDDLGDARLELARLRERLEKAEALAKACIRRHQQPASTDYISCALCGASEPRGGPTLVHTPSCALAAYDRAKEE